MTTNDFIYRAIAKHGNKYDYSKVKYIDKKTKVCIICHELDEFGCEHGEFWIIPDKHLYRGDGCRKCSGKEPLNTDIFIKHSNKIHNNFYNYSKVNYINYKTKVNIICPIHGEFEQTPNKHLNGQGCPKCRYIKSANSKRRSLEEVINIANTVHNYKYDYSLMTEYKNDRTKYPIMCKEHGIFYQTMNNHIHFKEDCPICGKLKSIESRRYTQDEWIAKAIETHKGKYNYSKVNYTGSDNKVTIICPKHGEFEQLPQNHLYGHGCPICKQSKLEIEMEHFLKEKNIPFESQKRFKWLGKQSLDFYLPDYNIAIECQGKQHFLNESFGHETFSKIKQRDDKKRILCQENNIKILYFSNLNITYPYKVYENKEELLTQILE